MLRIKTKGTALVTLALFFLSTVFAFAPVAPAHGASGTVSITIEVEFRGTPPPTMSIYLWQQAGYEDGGKIVEEFYPTATNTKAEYQQPRYYDVDKEYIYTVQANSPEGYGVIFESDSPYFRIIFEEKDQVEEVKAKKEWSRNIPNNVIRPDISFELWERVPGSATDEKLDVKPLVNNEAIFQVPIDPNALAAPEYYVREIFDDPDDPTNDNWEVSEDGLYVFNQLKEPTGFLVVEKVWEGDEDTDEKFEIVVTGPYGYYETIWLGAGEQIALENLYYGYYGVWS